MHSLARVFKCQSPHSHRTHWSWPDYYLWPFRSKETLMNFMNLAIEQTIDDKIHSCGFSDAYTDIRWFARKKKSHTIFAHDCLIPIPVCHPTWGTCIFSTCLLNESFFGRWGLLIWRIFVSIIFCANRLYSSMIYARHWEERWSKRFSFFFFSSFFSSLASQ